MKKRYSEEQIIGFLREADAGVAIKDLCRRHGFSEASYYLWRSKFGGMSVIIHSDQGSQFGSDDFNRWCKDQQLVTSMSRRGNCYDNAVVESFFSSLKKERIKRKIFASRQEARAEVFDYIEGFYNRTRRHSHLGLLSPYEFEQLHTGS